ncbi:hypothetical protein ACFKJK_01650, partial [Streptococcus agalactiae]|uniref:hypothetical protein n=1 Tax=Streptococcus agalactiae TaxID=1311 RepID=UPI003637A02D
VKIDNISCFNVSISGVTASTIDFQPEIIVFLNVSDVFQATTSAAINVPIAATTKITGPEIIEKIPAIAVNAVETPAKEAVT